jgi:hypothetical protein
LLSDAADYGFLLHSRFDFDPLCRPSPWQIPAQSSLCHDPFQTSLSGRTEELYSLAFDGVAEPEGSIFALIQIQDELLVLLPLSRTSRANAPSRPDRRFDVLGEALAAAKDSVESNRSDALLALAPYLAPEQFDEALAAALAVAKAVRDGDKRSFVLAALAPHLVPERLGEAFEAARAIGSESARARALAALAPQLGREQLSEALMAAKAIGSKSGRLRTLAALAPYLGPEPRAAVLGEALAAARAIGREFFVRTHWPR